MKSVRVWLLVFLAVLVPLRGAVAAGMLCPCAPAAGLAHHHSALEHAGSMAEHEHAAVHEHDAHHAGHHAQLDAHASHHNHVGSGHASKCTLCADCCSGNVLATSTVTLVAPLEPSAQTFPASTPPAPTFVSGGQERPPRSI